MFNTIQDDKLFALNALFIISFNMSLSMLFRQFAFTLLGNYEQKIGQFRPLYSLVHIGQNLTILLIILLLFLAALRVFYALYTGGLTNTITNTLQHSDNRSMTLWKS